MDYTQQEIELPALTRLGQAIKVSAWIAGDTGLAYHGAGGNEEDGFVITHLASKKALCQPLGTAYEAKLLLESVASITSWHQSEKELANQPKIGAEIINLQKDIEGQINQRLESAMKANGMPEYLVEQAMELIEEDDECFRSALLYACKIVC